MANSLISFPFLYVNFSWNIQFKMFAQILSCKVISYYLSVCFVYFTPHIRIQNRKCSYTNFIENSTEKKFPPFFPAFINGLEYMKNKFLSFACWTSHMFCNCIIRNSILLSFQKHENSPASRNFTIETFSRKIDQTKSWLIHFQFIKLKWLIYSFL